MREKHPFDEAEIDPAYSRQWSDVREPRHCRHFCRCSCCGELLHAEEGYHYCPRCDECVLPKGEYHEAY